MFKKNISSLLLLISICACCHGYRNSGGEVRYIDELLNDSEESSDNSVIQSSGKKLKETKRSVEDSDLITNTFENNEDDLMAEENGKNNVENTEYTFHEPSVSNYESDDLMTVSSPALITKNVEDTPATYTDIMSPIANEREDILTAVATKGDITSTAKLREKRSKKSKKNKIAHQSGDLSSIFSEIQSSKHHKLTRSDIRKLAKHAVLLATLGKLEEKKSEKGSKKTKIKSKKNSKSHKSNNSKKEISKNSKKHKPKSTTKDDKESTANINALQMNDIINDNKNNNAKTSDTKEPNTETPGVKQGDTTSKPLTETTDGKETKEEVVAETVNTKDDGESRKTPTADKNKSNGVAKTDNEKPVLSISGNDMFNNSDSVGAVIKNSKDAWNKSSEFTEDLTGKEKKLTTLDELSDDALFNAINKNTTPELDNSTLSIENLLKFHGYKTTNTQNLTPAPTGSSKKTTTKTKDTQNMPISATQSSDITSNKSQQLRNDTEDDVVKKSVIARVDKVDFSVKENITLQNKTKKSELPQSNIEIRNKINKLRDIISKTTPDKIPEQFLPDLPSGLRMIAWKQLLEKKKKQLAELAAAFPSENNAKPVTIDINIDHAGKNHAEVTNTQNPVLSDNSETTIENPKTGTKKTSLPDNQNDNNQDNSTGNATETKLKPEDLNSHHVKYLQKHIKSARSLRKLIAKTLIGHCKSTGKRILEAFIAMDKALERAQTIAEVIGKKFHVNPDKIQTLVGSKEDEVVETFLRDIFTKL